MTATTTQQKYLSYSAILAIAANTMNGPAFTTLPDVAADAGLCLYVVLITLSVAMAAFVCRRMVNAMWSSVDGDDEESNVVKTIAGKEAEEPERASEKDSLIPKEAGAGDHGRRPLLETTSIVGQSREAYGGKTSVCVAETMIVSALCLALAQMMICAAILDGMFVALGGKSCALGWPDSSAEDPSWIHCTSLANMKPYAGSGAPVSLISVGTAVAAAASVTLGTFDLDDMMSIQYFLFGCLGVAAVRFSLVLRNMANGLDEVDGGDDFLERMLGEEEDGDGSSPMSSAVNWFVGPDPFQTIGPIMFNFAFIVTSPPSVVMAKKESIAYKSLGMACVVMGAMYTMVGLSGASVSTAVRDGRIEGGNDSNLLSLILLSGGESGPALFDLIIIGMFGFSTMASIPVYCLLAKNGIMEFGVPPIPSFLLSNVLPWIIVASTYNAAFFEAFVNWSGLLVLGYANFSLPLLLDLKLKQTRAMGKLLSGAEARSATLTKGVLILVTASITLVIVMSISNSLILASIAFLLVFGLMAMVKL